MAAMIAPRADAAGGTVLAEQPGPYYDKLLIERQRGRDVQYVIVARMRCQFDFIGDGLSGVWGADEKRAWMNGFHRAVRVYWCREPFISLPGRRVATRFETRIVAAIETPMPSRHWLVKVLPLDPSGTAKYRIDGQVDYGAHEVLLNKRSVERVLADGRSINPVAHELGHMLGYATDEYDRKEAPAYHGDKDGLMNRGSLIRARYLARFIDWASPLIQKADNERKVEERRDRKSIFPW